MKGLCRKKIGNSEIILVRNNTAIEIIAGGAIPALAQVVSSSYHAALSSPTFPPPSEDDKIQKSRTSSTLQYYINGLSFSASSLRYDFCFSCVNATLQLRCPLYIISAPPELVFEIRDIDRLLCINFTYLVLLHYFVNQQGICFANNVHSAIFYLLIRNDFTFHSQNMGQRFTSHLGNLFLIVILGICYNPGKICNCNLQWGVIYKIPPFSFLTENHLMHQASILFS